MFLQTGCKLVCSLPFHHSDGCLADSDVSQLTKTNAGDHTNATPPFLNGAWVNLHLGRRINRASTALLPIFTYLLRDPCCFLFAVHPPSVLSLVSYLDWVWCRACNLLLNLYSDSWNNHPAPQSSAAWVAAKDLNPIVNDAVKIGLFDSHRMVKQVQHGKETGNMENRLGKKKRRCGDRKNDEEWEGKEGRDIRSDVG